MPFWKNNPRLRTLSRLFIFLLLGFMFLRWFEHAQTYHPSRSHEAKPQQYGLAFEEVFLDDDPKIHGWFFPASADSPRRHRVFLVCHGNGGNISHRLDLAEILLKTGASVFLFDYRGYGQSTGHPSEEGTYHDAQIAYAWLKQKGFAGANTIALGESLGGGIAAELAVREPLGGLILHSTFTSTPDLGAELFPWLPVRLLSRIRYEVLDKLPQLKMPVLVMHSRADGLIGFHHAEKNYEAAFGPKLFWEIQGGHCAVTAVDAENFANGIEKFLALVEKTPLTNGATTAPPL